MVFRLKRHHVCLVVIFVVYMFTQLQSQLGSFCHMYDVKVINFNISDFFFILR